VPVTGEASSGFLEAGLVSDRQVRRVARQRSLGPLFLARDQIDKALQAHCTPALGPRFFGIANLQWVFYPANKDGQSRNARAVGCRKREELDGLGRREAGSHIETMLDVVEHPSVLDELRV
jgi:hypothetical protein